MTYSDYVVPSTMDALVLTGPNEFEVQEAPTPEPAPHEVLCEVHSVAICGTDTELIGGHFLKKGWPPGYPYTPGHEWSGVVVAAGEGSADLGFEVGTRVAGTARARRLVEARGVAVATHGHVIGVGGLHPDLLAPPCRVLGVVDPFVEHRAGVPRPCDR